LEESGALGFFIADLGVVPNFQRDLFVGFSRALDLGDEFGFGFLSVGRRGETTEGQEWSAEGEQAESQRWERELHEGEEGTTTKREKANDFRR
jgi:hypothetical protein